MLANLEGHDARSDEFDPLMACNFMIWNAAVEGGGLYLLAEKEDGTHYCPVCEAVYHHTTLSGGTPEVAEKSWIEGPTNQALEIAREKGLMPKAPIPN